MSDLGNLHKSTTLESDSRSSLLTQKHIILMTKDFDQSFLMPSSKIWNFKVITLIFLFLHFNVNIKIGNKVEMLFI